MEAKRLQAGRRDEFLSEEDLDLVHCSDVELDAWWDLWLELAQASNEFDEYEYSHGVFREVPLAARGNRVHPSVDSTSSDPGPSRVS